MHEADRPDSAVDFSNAYPLNGEHVAEIDFAASDATPNAVASTFTTPEDKTD